MFARVQRCTLLVLLSILSTMSIVEAQQTISLANGDRLTGRLAKIEAKVWEFQFEGGTGKLPAGQIVGFSSADPIGIRLTDGTIAAATVTSSNGSLVLTMLDGATRSIRPGELEAVGDATNLSALRPVKIGVFTPFLRFWRATAGLGFSDKSGNSRARGLTASGEVERRSPRDRINLSLGMSREQSRTAAGDFELTVSKFYGALRTDLFFSSRLFAYAETRQERDTFQDIDLRSTYNGGLGIQIIATKTTDLRFSASGGARIENFVANGSATSAVINTGTDIRQALGPATFAWKTAWAPDVQDFGDYRFRSDITLTAAVYKGVGFRIGLLHEFDSTPQPGVKRLDTLITSTITYSISQ
ncbi:MAG: YdiY family protein [Gemmatimonadales bacterium]